MKHTQLERARESLQQARESAGTDSIVREQIDSLQEGVFEEDVGDKTARSSVPKIDRIAEIRDKLGDLEEEADDRETIEHIADARDHLREYMRVRSESNE